MSEELKITADQIRQFYKAYCKREITDEQMPAYFFAFSKTDRMGLIDWIVMGYEAGYEKAKKDFARTLSH